MTAAYKKRSHGRARDRRVAIFKLSPRERTRVTAAQFRVDLHVKVLDERVVRRAKARNLDALVYAPHFTRLPDVERQAAAFSDDGLLVVPGREIFTGDWQTRKHVLGIGLSDPIPDFITLEGAMAELDRQDAAVLVPHPGFLTVSLDRADVERYADVIDAVEVYNPKHLPRHNRRAVGIARETGLPGFTSSYAHLRGTVGEAWTAFEEPMADAGDLVSALGSGTPRRIFHRDGVGHRLRCGLEFAHLGYENTWEKFDRVFLSGTEPTHPDHLAYRGQFDDVRV
ncbi:metal-dependent phosphoesterase [Halobacteriales archaeon QS_1_68_17]|nr:MAG: metal-dependent phosphoesterase [Halobacteriales archaeon QS_1_68_17]